MSEFVARTVIRVNIKDLSSVELIAPERLVIEFDRTTSQDIGALCYRRRLPLRRGSATRFVDPNSIDETWIKQVRAFTTFFSDQYQLGAQKSTTMSRQLHEMIAFIEWCEDTRHVNVLANVSHARKAFRDYVHHLKDISGRGEISRTTAAGKQSIVLNLLRGFLDVDNLHAGLALIDRKRTDGIPTSPQDDKDAGRVLGWCAVIFEGFRDLVVNHLEFPYRLAIPRIPGWDVTHLWIMPSPEWCMSPPMQKKRGSKGRGYWAWDYVNGRIVDDPTKIAEHYGGDEPYHRLYRAKETIDGAHDLLTAANRETHHSARLILASMAAHAFVQLFYANTAMNGTLVEDLTWNDDYRVERADRQGFRVIKWRADGREQSFEIQSIFVQSFRQYLLLRDYLLNGTPCDRLFFNRGPFQTATPERYRSNTFSFKRRLKQIDPDIPGFGSRQHRSNKADWLTRQKDIATTAAVLQNDESTVKRHYIVGSEIRHTEEMSEFFDRLEIKTDRASDPLNSRDSSVGTCKSFAHPAATNKGLSITPDCRQPEGCLFCDHFYLHADEQDIRKLGSCRYVITQTAHLSASIEHFESIFGPVLSRIKRILRQICELGDQEQKMVDRVIQEVEEEEQLSPYWEQKLQLLIEYGFVR